VIFRVKYFKNERSFRVQALAVSLWEEAFYGPSLGLDVACYAMQGCSGLGLKGTQWLWLCLERRPQPIWERSAACAVPMGFYVRLIAREISGA